MWFLRYLVTLAYVSLPWLKKKGCRGGTAIFVAKKINIFPSLWIIATQ